MAADGDRIQGARDADSSEVEFEIANEFAQVIVSKVRTRNGERLSIRSPKLNREIVLCPLESESLTWQSDETFTEFLSTPFGPSDS